MAPHAQGTQVGQGIGRTGRTALNDVMRRQPVGRGGAEPLRAPIAVALQARGS